MVVAVVVVAVVALVVVAVVSCDNVRPRLDGDINSCFRNFRRRCSLAMVLIPHILKLKS